MSEVDGRPLALARHYVDVERHQSALDALAGVADEDVADPEYWLIRAEALRGLERPADASESARRGLELDPEDVGLLDALALSELDQDQFDSAKTALEAALALVPDHPALQSHMALALARAGDFGGAFHALAEALKLAPDDVGVRRVRAQVAFIAEDPTAEAYVADLLERAPDDQTGHLLRGLLIARRKDFVPAARAIAEAARLDPSNRGVAEAARETGILAHPLLAPVRPIWRFGRWRAWFVFLALSVVLAGTGHPTLRLVLIVVWVSIAALSWTVPPFLRWRARRRFGGR